MRSIGVFFEKFELSRLTLGLLIVAPGLLYTAPAGAAETPDQSQTVSESFVTVSSSFPRAQVFTAGQYGRLGRVSLRLENYTSSPPAGSVLTVSVQTVIGGLPSGKQIGSGTIPLSAIPPPGDPGWVDINIGDAVMVAGTQYALVLRTSQVFAQVNWWEAYGQYAGGAMAFNDGNGWRIDLPEDDFTFKTYVIPDTLDQSHPSKTAMQEAAYGWTLGQTFTAGQSGVLDRVRVFLSQYTSLTGPLYAHIETVKGGFPSGIVIGQGQISASSIPAWPGGWVSIGINGVVVTAGTQYALVLRVEPGEGGSYLWGKAHDGYTGGDMVYNRGSGWMVMTDTCDCADSGTPYDTTFQTYVATPLTFSPPPPPPATTTPCSSGVCPAVTGSIVPKDSTARVTSLVHFQERRDGTVHGILNFDDSRTGNLVLQGCTTESAACRLTVTTFACTAQDSILVAGTYTPKGEDAAHYRLTLSGDRRGIGTFTLTTGNDTYTLTLKGIVDVTCPPVVGD